MKAAFLDRDGVINKDHSYVHSWEKFEFCDGAIDAMADLMQLGYTLFIISNQSGIARGLFTENDVLILHQQLRLELKKFGVFPVFDYFCPHHPEASIDKYRMSCTCRKPRPGMVERAVSEHNIDLQSSILVGDKITDIQCAINSGIPNYFKIKSKYTMPNEQIMLKEYANLSKVVEQVRKL